MTVGERIKRYRIKRGMTQSALAGSYITRNMLSRIENGAAKPSLGTVEYLTERLGLPGGYLLSDKEDADRYERTELTAEFKKLYGAKKYAECIKKVPAQGLGELLCDEISFILADSYLISGIDSYKAGAMAQANQYLSACVTYCDKTVYTTTSIKNTAKLYLNLINFHFGKYAGDFIDFFDDSFFGYDYLCEFIYVYCLELIEAGDTEQALASSELPMFTNESYVMHINARYELARGNIPQARELLFDILQSAKKPLAASLLYNVYSDLEICCKQTEDYKNAYKFSNLKNELYTKFFK